jgi:solute carrier family 25 iron transporter 28/37
MEPSSASNEPAKGAVAQGSATLDLDWEEWDGRMPFWKHAFAGSCAGVMEHLGMFPLDTVKTRMQALRPGATAASSLSMGGVLRDIVGNQGARGFMRGCSAIAAGTIPAHVALFTTYEITKKQLLDGRDHDVARAAVCGAASQFSHDFFITPADVVKQRMQLGCHTCAYHSLTSIMRQEGASALFRSLPTTLAMNLPFGAILVASNETFKHSMCLDETTDGRSALPWYFISAGISGGIAAAATQPLDVIKTRLQTQDCLARDFAPASSEAVPPAQKLSSQLIPKYNGFVMAAKMILREEGAAAFFHGLAPRVLYTIPAAAICWGTYDSIKSFMLSEPH